MGSILKEFLRGSFSRTDWTNTIVSCLNQIDMWICLFEIYFAIVIKYNIHLFGQYRQYKDIDNCKPRRAVGQGSTQFFIAEIFVAVAESDSNIHRFLALHDGHRLLLNLTLLIVREIIAGTTSEHWVLFVILSLLIIYVLMYYDMVYEIWYIHYTGIWYIWYIYVHIFRVKESLVQLVQF